MSNKVKRKLKIFQKINGYKNLPQEQRDMFEAALITPKLKLHEIYEAMQCLNGLPYSGIEAVGRSKRCPKKFAKVILTMMTQPKRFEVGGEMGNGDGMPVAEFIATNDNGVVEEMNENGEECVGEESVGEESVGEEEDDGESLYNEIEDLRNEVMELKIESTAVNTALKKLVDVVEESLKKINRNLNEKIETIGVLLPPKMKPPVEPMSTVEKNSSLHVMDNVMNNSNDKVNKIIRQMKIKY